MHLSPNWRLLNSLKQTQLFCLLVAVVSHSLHFGRPIWRTLFVNKLKLYCYIGFRQFKPKSKHCRPTVPRVNADARVKHRISKLPRDKPDEPVPICEMGIFSCSPETVLALLRSPRWSLDSEGLCFNKQEISKVPKLAASHGSGGRRSGATALTLPNTQLQQPPAGSVPKHLPSAD